MASKRCPVCKLVNPGTAQACDCGYSFATGMPGEAPEVTPTQSLRQVAKVTGIGALTAVLAGITVGLGASSSFYQQVGIGLFAVGVILASVARWLWRASRFTRD